MTTSDELMNELIVQPLDVLRLRLHGLKECSQASTDSEDVLWEQNEVRRLSFYGIICVYSQRRLCPFESSQRIPT